MTNEGARSAPRALALIGSLQANRANAALRPGKRSARALACGVSTATTSWLVQPSLDRVIPLRPRKRIFRVSALNLVPKELPGLAPAARPVPQRPRGGP